MPWPQNAYDEPPPRRGLTPAQWDEIVQRHGDGESVKSLALAFSVPASIIRSRVGTRPAHDPGHRR